MSILRAPGLLTLSLGLALVGSACGPHEGVRVYVPAAPPPRVAESITVAPGPEYLWVPGYHVWNGSAYIWTPGRWERRPANRRAWVPGHWNHDRHGWYWVEGHWR